MDIELFDTNKHDIDEIKVILSMATGDPTPENLDSLLGDFYTSDNRLLFIASINHVITGIIGIDRSGKSSGLIKHLAVLPKNRKHGIGRCLINETAKVLGLSTIELETDQDAVDFYHACGFTSIEIESKYPGIHRFRCTRNMIE
ncbi:MAG: GNAT family N-acetyltransferase [Dehalococcoidales bacterium]|nr:GNAT family N-acetyltransferase [Dehalococcoidales bacterium]